MVMEGLQRHFSRVSLQALSSCLSSATGAGSLSLASRPRQQKTQSHCLHVARGHGQLRRLEITCQLWVRHSVGSSLQPTAC